MFNQVEDYLKAHSAQVQDAIDLVEEFSDELKKMQGKCLDIGCGPGTTTRNLILPRLPSDAHIVGLDLSKRMIEFAETQCADEKRLSFIQFDIETDNLPSHLINAYNNAISIYCLHWCQNPRRAFENIYQLLRPGGEVLILIMARANLFESFLELSKKSSYKAYMKDVEKLVGPFYYSANPRMSLKTILKETGFDVIHCSKREITFTYDNAEQMTKHMLSVTPFLDQIPDSLRPQFDKDYQSDLLSRMSFFENTKNCSKEERRILNKFEVLIAYFKKPLH